MLSKAIDTTKGEAAYTYNGFGKRVATSTYAYDEFGRNINPFIGQKEKPAYTKNGNIIQPLAFTGYQHDEMTGSYFAQARYYDSNAGRFVSEDKVRGFVGSPDTINHYLYCWNSPVDKEDLDGNLPIKPQIDIKYQSIGKADICNGTYHISRTVAESYTIAKKTSSAINNTYHQVLNTASTSYNSIKNTVTEKVDTVSGMATEYLDELESINRPICVLGASASFGAGLYGSVGAQKVIDPVKILTDPMHAVGYQVVGGAGAEAGASADGSVYFGIYYADDIAWTEGFGTEIGGSGGEGVILGGGLWIAGEADEENKYGAFISLGLGGEGVLAEGHTSMGETSPTFYPFELIYKLYLHINGIDEECGE